VNARTPTDRSSWQKAGALALIAAGPTLAAVLGARASKDGLGAWYRSLRKPSWNPPSSVFGPVWTVLYTAMAVSAYRVWRQPASRARTTALALWVVQLALNAAWSPLFFARRKPKAALGDVAAMVPAVGAYALAAARVDRPAGWMMLPYLGWTSFATALNAAIVRRNPRR
jgi:tryptophan-rich sensory protein